MFRIFLITGIFLSILFQQIYTDEDDYYQFNLFEPYSAGGNPANITDYPYQVSLQYSFYGHVCGGAIISDEWILTTARCVSKFSADKLTVVVGTTALDDKAATTLEVQQVIIHENFENSYLPDYDIAVLRVNRMTLGETVNTIDLPNQDDEPIMLPSPCTFTGWGAKEVGGDIPWDLQSLPQTTLDFALCKASFKNSTNGALILPNSTLCTMNFPPWVEDTGPCLGEWGSPLVCNGLLSPAGNRLLGLLSGDPLFCGRLVSPNLFTQVSSFRDWIRNATNV